jgi:oligopeptide transport system substrate-binding protein
MSIKSNLYIKKNSCDIFVLFALMIFISSCKNKEINHTDRFNTFNYNIPYAPQTFDPLLQQGVNSKHLLNNLYLTLLKWDQYGNLISSGADKCEWEQKNLICHLRKGLTFQDDTPIYAQHYLNSINLLKKENLKETFDFKKIKFIAKDDFTLIIKSNKKNLSLKHKLTLLEVSARKDEKYYKSAESVISSTNFKIVEYKKNQNITLEQISKTVGSKKVQNAKKKLRVKIHFIDDQSTALRLYKSKKLNALIQLPIREIDPFINSTAFFYVPMVRMDGMYFDKTFDTNLTKSLFHALNYSELQFLYKSKGTPGCPSLPRDFYSQDLCYSYDLILAKELLKKAKAIPKKIKLTYSTLGGDDIQRGMEWMSNQWKKNLNLNIELDPSESGVFFQKIRDRKFNIVRKGSPLDAPSCIEALNIFLTKNPNNLTEFKNTSFEHLIELMEASEPNSIYDMQKLCDQGLKILYENYVFLPLGPIYFSYLNDGLYKGWFINMLNTLDLEQLELK